MYSVSDAAPNLPANLRQTRELYGKSEIAQLLEIARLVLGPGHLSPWDYHAYRLWDDRLTWAQKREFIGNNILDWTVHKISDPALSDLMRDKICVSKIFDDNRIPTPRTQAVYHPTRELEGTRVLRDADEVARFVRKDADYPFFFKPVTAHVSIGAGLASSYDSASDQLVMLEGDPVSVDEFARFVVDYCTDGERNLVRPDAGYLFQDTAVQHPEIAERCGSTFATLRVCVGIDDRGPHIFASPWKIPAPGVAADNFYRTGNLLADVDHETGEVRRVIRGTGASLEAFDENPYTGRRLTGWRLPRFDEVRDTVLRGAALFPGARLQGWDVGVGPDGPMVIEANYGASFRLPQHATGVGLATPAFREYLRRAEAINDQRRPAWPISWNRRESIWRLEGVWHLAQSLLTR